MAAADSNLVYRNIVEHMSGGVMTIDPGGTVMTFNAAAARLLAFDATDVLGRVLAEVFLTEEGLDEFTEAIVAAVYEKEIGHQQTVTVSRGGTPRSLAMTTSYLRTAEDGGAERNVGVIAMFNDITELKALREAELRLAEEAEAQHAELRDAYREIEEKNRILDAGAKRVHVLRTAATVFVAVLFLAAGIYGWNIGAPAQETYAAPGPGADGQRYTVTPQRITSTLSLIGILAPLREVSVTSPMTGTVAATHFDYGEQVARGEPLIDLDTAAVEHDHRTAEAQYIKALGRLEEVENWAEGVQVAQVRRSISKARLALDAQKSRLDETAVLLEKGVIPASEHESAEQQYRSQQLDYEALQQDLEVVLAEGEGNALRVARLEVDDARIRLHELERILQEAMVTAPVAGVVLRPRVGEPSGQDEKLVAEGQPVSQGEHLLTIGDLDGFSLVARVDEVDIAKVRPGLRARITGDAFPGLELAGTISRVSSEADRGPGSGALPSFEIAVAIDDLDAAGRERLRLGMSADIAVVVHDKPDALLVPIGAVRTQGGRSRLRVADGGTVRDVVVETGMTTVRAVEVVAGIEAGDVVVLPQP